MWALLRTCLAGAQNSAAFAALLRAPLWTERLLRLAAFPAWRRLRAPHSAAETYLPRGFALAQAAAVRLLLALLPATREPERNGESEGAKEAMETNGENEAMEAMEAKDLKETKESNDSNASNDSIEPKDSIDSKDSNDSKDSIDSIEPIEPNDSREPTFSPEPNPPHTAPHSPSSARAAAWRGGWRALRQLLPGDEFPALELLVQALLDPASVARYCERRSAQSAPAVDLDAVTRLWAQQLGEGALLEHSQALHGADFAARQSLLLLPLRVPPALPLLPQWFLMPLLRLRFRRVGETGKPTPFAVQNERDALAEIEFVRELETCAESPLDPREKPLRCYGVLHLCLAGNAIVSSPAVNTAFEQLLPVYLTPDPRMDAQDDAESENRTDFGESKKTGDFSNSKNRSEKAAERVCRCRKHDDCIQRMGDVVPKTELLDFLDRCCRCVAEEYYFCPLVLRVLLLFLPPCREWNQRVLLLNFFLDHAFAGMLLEADSQSLQTEEVTRNVEDGDIQSALKRVMKHVEEEGCVWEEKEEVMEMYIRYLEQAVSQGNVSKPVLVLNHMYVELLHYVHAKNARYNFYEKELRRITPFINVESLFE